MIKPIFPKNLKKSKKVLTKPSKNSIIFLALKKRVLRLGQAKSYAPLAQLARAPDS